MTTYRSLNQTKWHCQYHVVFVPKYRKKAIYGGLREQLGEVLRQRALHRESRVEDGHLLVDHVHMLVSIPPKYSVARWSAISRGSARSTSPARWRIGPGTSWGSTFGRGGPSSRPWVATSK